MYRTKIISGLLSREKKRQTKNAIYNASVQRCIDAGLLGAIGARKSCGRWTPVGGEYQNAFQPVRRLKYLVLSKEYKTREAWEGRQRKMYKDSSNCGTIHNQTRQERHWKTAGNVHGPLKQRDNK